MHNTDYTSLKVGIVGAGLMGLWHANVATRLGAVLASVVDTNQSLALQLADKFKNSPAVYSDLDTMLANTPLDILHICTPVESHFAIAMQAIEAGVHVVIEKPLATTLNKTTLLLNAAKEKNIKICPVHQFGFQDGVQKTISALNSLGELLQLRFTTNSAGGCVANTGQVNNTLNDIIADILPHPLSVLQRIRPGINFDSNTWSGIHTRKGELQLIGEAAGIGLDIYISMNARPTRCEMELFCTDGRIVLDFFHGYALIEKGKVTRMQKLSQPFKYAINQLYTAGKNIIKRSLTGERAYPGLTSLIEQFYQSVNNDATLPISTSDILNVARARDNLLERFLNTKL